MNKAKRFLALAGMGVAAGAMIGMGPAQATPSGGRAASSASHFGDEHVVGYYRTEWSCERAGFTGKRFGAWDAYDCGPVRYGWRGWVFQLIVDEDDWLWDDWRGPWPGGWPYRPDFAGRPFHLRGGHGRPIGFPPRGPIGMPDRDNPRGGPDRDDPRGMPDRDNPRGWPDRDNPRGMPDRDNPRGRPDRDDPRGMPDRDDPRGMPDRDDPRGRPDRDDPRGMPDRDNPRGQPDRDDPRGMPDRDNPRGMPDRDAPKGMPPRDDHDGPRWPRP